MISKSFPAKTESLADVIGFVEETLETYHCSFKIMMSLTIAIEEVFVNVAHYAYADKDGMVTFDIEFDDENQEVTFYMSDEGIPFDPLKKPDPDITLSLEEREIGGLGIFITKKTMDAISYSYENGKNILTMVKKL